MIKQAPCEQHIDLCLYTNTLHYSLTSLVEFPPHGQACMMAGNMCLSMGWEPMEARVRSNSRPFRTNRRPSVVLPIDVQHNNRYQFMHHSTHTWFINKVEYMLYVYIIIEWENIVRHIHTWHNETQPLCVYVFVYYVW
jgi:hypothetical protein